MIGLNKINQTMITGGAIGANPRGPSDQQSKTAGHGKRGKQSFPLNLRKEFEENHIKNTRGRFYFSTRNTFLNRAAVIVLRPLF